MGQYPKYDRAARDFNRLAGKIFKGTTKALRASVRAAARSHARRRKAASSISHNPIGSGSCSICGVKINLRASSIGTIKKCPACGAKLIVKLRQRSALTGCIGCVACLGFLGAVAAAMVFVVIRSEPANRPLEKHVITEIPVRTDAAPREDQPHADPREMEEPSRHLQPMSKYIVHFAKGKPRAILDYVDEADSYVLVGLSGSRGRYPKSMIDHIEPLDKLEESGPLRNWVDRSGKHEIEAAFVALDGEFVQLRKADNKTITVLVEKLSDDDQRFVREQVAKGLSVPSSDEVESRPTP